MAEPLPNGIISFSHPSQHLSPLRYETNNSCCASTLLPNPVVLLFTQSGYVGIYAARKEATDDDVGAT
jgi:hypothetical protein